MMKDKTPRQIIDELGDELGVGRDARKKWFSRGVAHRWRLPLIEAARSKGIQLDPEWFDNPANEGKAA